jgi:hypothetical protein
MKWPETSEVVARKGTHAPPIRLGDTSIPGDRRRSPGRRISPGRVGELRDQPPAASFYSSGRKLLQVTAAPCPLGTGGLTSRDASLSSKAHSRIAQRGRLAVPKPPLQTAAVICLGIRLATPVALATLEDHLDTAHSGKPSLEVLEQRMVVPVNDN